MREGVDVTIELMRQGKESAVSGSLRLLLGWTSQSRDNKVDPWSIQAAVGTGFSLGSKSSKHPHQHVLQRVDRQLRYVVVGVRQEVGKKNMAHEFMYTFTQTFYPSIPILTAAAQLDREFFKRYTHQGGNLLARHRRLNEWLYP